MSTSSSGTNPSSQEEQRQQHKYLFDRLPGIQIITPPSGRFSNNVDERCITYCSQSVSGRINRREPWCRSICIRKVFTHEVRNLIHFKQHRKVNPDGSAKYPLPAEGQNLPTYLRRKSAENTDKSRKDNTEYWEEGRYLWFTKSWWAAQEHMDLMRSDFQKQKEWAKRKVQKREDWLEYQKYMKEMDKIKERADKGESVPPFPTVENRWWGHIRPSYPPPDASELSLLLPLPPPILPPLSDKIQTLLAPTHKLLGILHHTLESGQQKQLAFRLWEKAWTNEPFVLASRACSRIYQQWKEGPPDDTDDNPGTP